MTDIKKFKTISFMPKFSIFSRDNKPLSFDMLNDFDFSSIKNIITLKFINNIPAIVVKFFVAIKQNLIRFIVSPLLATVTLFCGTKNNKLKLKNMMSARIKLDARFAPQSLKFNNNISGRLKIYLSTHKSIAFKNTANLSIIIRASSKVGLKFNSKVHSDLLLKMSAYVSTLKFAQNAPNLMPVFLAASKGNILDFNNESSAVVKLLSNTYNNKLKLSSTASATVWRPIALSTLYDQTIESWYDKTIEDIFYGHELI